MSQPSALPSRAPRYPYDAAVRHPAGEGRCRNISNSGMYFEAAAPFPVGAVIDVSLVLNHVQTIPPVELVAAGRVVRVERLADAIGVAVHFDALRFETADTRAARA